MRIQTKASLTFLAISLVPLALVGVVSYQNGQNLIKSTLGTQFQRYAHETLGNIDRRLAEVHQSVRTWSNLDVMQDIQNGDSQGRISNFLGRISRDYEYVSSLNVVDPGGIILASSNADAPGQSVAKELFFINVMRGRSNLGDAHLDPISNERVVTFSFPIYDRDDREHMIGVLSAHWRVDALIGETLREEEGEVNPFDYFMVMRGEGLMIYGSDPEIQKDSYSRNLLWEGMLSARRATEGVAGYLVEEDYNGVKSLIGYDYSRGFKDFSGFGWAVIALQNVKKAYVPVEKLKFMIIGVQVLVALTVVIIQLILTRRMTTPILNMSAAAGRVAHGDFDVKVDYESGDEIGSLADTFNSMIRDLKSQRAQLVEKDYVDNIIENMSDCLIVVNQDGQIRVVNRAAKTLLGYEEHELIGESMEKVIVSEDGLSFKDREAHDILEKGWIRDREVAYRTKTGDKILMSFTGSLMGEAGGEVEGIVCTAHDITERKQLQEQLIQSQKMEAVGKLAGGIAHDFNNILTIIITHADMLARKIPEDHPAVNLIAGLQKASNSATRLTTQLLAFSRRQVMQRSRIDINELVQTIQTLLMRVIGVNIKLIPSLADDLWYVEADQAYLEQVVTNLVVNARDAMPKGGQIVIETKNRVFDESYVGSHEGFKPGEYVMIAVSDTGHGMPEDVMKHIFEPFFTTKEKGKGTGLGLSTSYGIIKQMGGQIDVYSEVGHGTVFKIYLPRSVGARPGKEAVHVEDDSALRGKETILVVEDKPEVRDAVVDILSESGYKVLQADNGMEALVVAKMYSDEKIDLLLTDVIMPKISGKELATQLGASRPDMHIIFMSGYTDEAIVKQGVVDEGINFLQKPFTREMLLKTVRGVLDE